MEWPSARTWGIVLGLLRPGKYTACLIFKDFHMRLIDFVTRLFNWDNASILYLAWSIWTFAAYWRWREVGVSKNNPITMALVQKTLAWCNTGFPVHLQWPNILDNILPWRRECEEDPGWGKAGYLSTPSLSIFCNSSSVTDVLQNAVQA